MLIDYIPPIILSLIGAKMTGLPCIPYAAPSIGAFIRSSP